MTGGQEKDSETDSQTAGGTDGKSGSGLDFPRPLATVTPRMENRLAVVMLPKIRAGSRVPVRLNSDGGLAAAMSMVRLCC